MNRVTPFTNDAIGHLAHAKHELVHVQVTAIALLVVLLVEEELLRLVRPRDLAAVRPIRVAAAVLVVAFVAVVIGRAVALR